MTYYKNKRQESHYHIMKLFENDKEKKFRWSEIKRYIDENSKNDINDSTFTNALKQLINQQIIVVYKKNNYKLYQLSQQTNAKKEDFVEMTSVDKIIKKNLKYRKLKMNELEQHKEQLNLNTLQKTLYEVAELEDVTIEQFSQKLTKIINDLLINSKKEKNISELEKLIQNIIRDFKN